MVSILTTVYNREAYLAECIESVQAQRFTDYEHILVDDGSKDASVDIAKAKAASDPRILVHVNETNLGDYPNRNQAASHARGTYLKYLDADDMLGRWTLDMMMDAMEMHPEAALGLVDYSMPAPHWPEELSPEQAYERFYSGKTDIFKRSPLSAIIRRDAFESIQGFTGKRMVGDFEMWHRLAEQYPVVLIPHALSFYRRHDDSETATRHSNPIWALQYAKVSIDQLNNDACPLPKADKEVTLVQLERTAARSILLALKNHGGQKAKEMRAMMGWSWKSILRKAFAPMP